MANRKQRRHPGKVQGLTYADELARRKAVAQAAREATMDKAVQIKADIQAQRMLWLAVSKWSRWLAEETEIRRVETEE